MMRLARRVSLLVAFSLLASAATAYAEWVIWQEFEAWGHVKEPNHPMAAFGTKQECQQRMEKEFARAAFALERESKMGVEGNPSYKALGFLARRWGDNAIAIVHDSHPDKPIMKWTHLCLPDTVDPREPRGK